MKGGTLLVSRAEKLLPDWKEKLEGIGFKNVSYTSAEKDALNIAINDIEPGLLMISSKFYQAGTPYMAGQLLKMFPKLNICAVSTDDYPTSLAPWFIWRGVKSYINLWEVGYKEFYKCLQQLNCGKQVISPQVEIFIEQCGEWPTLRDSVTNRQHDCLLMLCSGLKPEEIGNKLQLSRNTICNVLQSLYKTFHVNSREEMTTLAWCMELVTQDDIQFDCKYLNKIKMPEWAEIKKSSNKFKLLTNEK